VDNTFTLAIDQTLLNVAKRNELIIAYVRVVALAIATVLDCCLAQFEPIHFSILNALVAASWLGVAIGVMIIIRRGTYHALFGNLLPVMDGVTIFSLFFSIFLTTPSPELLLQPANNVSVACALFIVSGALRLNRLAVGLTTLCAIVITALVGVLLDYYVIEIIFTCGMLLAVGVMAAWLADIVGRSLKDEIARQTLSRFLPKTVMESAYTEPLQLLTQPRSCEATILVTDLRGFTAFSESLEPPEVLAFLNVVQGCLAEIVATHGGSVDKFMGDGMLAVFGAMAVDPHHAMHAIVAAIAMNKALDEMRIYDARTPHLGVGLHTGRIVAGCLGSQLRLEFTIIGDAVNTASRLEALTKEYKVPIVVSEDTVAQITSTEDLPFTFEPLGVVTIRGKVKQINLFTVIAHE